LSLTAACTAEESVDGPGGADGNGSPTTGSGSTAQAVANLEIHALDIWGQPLRAAKLEVEADGRMVEGAASPKAAIALRSERALKVRLSADQFLPLEVALSFDGTSGDRGLTVGAFDASTGHGVAMAHRTGAQKGGVPKHVLFLGLRHKWFSAQGRPPRAGNKVELFHAGEPAWQSVRKALDAAKKSVLVSTWWWESDFELNREWATHHTLSSTQRWNNTIMGVLENSPATKRALVGQFLSQDGVLSWMTTDSYLRDHAKKLGDGFEMMGQANPTNGIFMWQPKGVDFAARVRASFADTSAMAFDANETSLIPSNVPGRQIDLTAWPVNVDIDHASYHQKFMVIDDGLAFVGGMNLRRVDWDTTKHDVFNHRRMKFGASYEDRLAVMNKEKLPDMGPRKDYLLRIQGPAAQDVADVFQRRWQHQLDSKVEYAAQSTPFEVNRAIAEEAGGLTVQITTTMPEPFHEASIAESWYNAVGNAERFILIEDQYFRAPMLNERIKARMIEKPDLVLVVITKPINEWADPGCAWTYLTHQLFSAMFPGRYLSLQLRSFDTQIKDGVFTIDETKGHFVDMDIHSKLLVVDDLFMSVGSANKNNRGMVYEAEMNAVIVDAIFVRAERRAALAEILPAGASISDDAKAWFAALAATAKSNDAVHANWSNEGFDLNLNGAALPAKMKPAGFVYSLPFNSLKKCLLESVGPDMTGSSGD
jgi:phosphatidylserine/phosphatidylglycerophosphate/cardiolipin synthase-like enzyme